MTTTEQTMTEWLAHIDEASRRTDAQRRDAADKRQAAEQARAEGDRLDAAAEDAARVNHNATLQALNRIMRELSQQVSDARQACLDAIAHGEGALDSWIRYRLTAARARGSWSSLADDYQRLTGRDAPPGPHIPELRAEPFDQLLRSVLP